MLTPPSQIVVGPEIFPGKGLTFKFFVEKQPVPNVYVSVELPTLTDVTNPVLEFTVATAGLAIDHVPPGVGSVAVVVDPLHIAAALAIGSGNGLVVTVAVTKHPFESV
jgi:hypothetical protein